MVMLDGAFKATRAIVAVTLALVLNEQLFAPAIPAVRIPA
jgi:hypothetical protein